MDLVEVVEESTRRLSDVASIPIAFTVRRVLDVALQEEGFGGIVLRERTLAQPYEKDYDRIAGEGPLAWSSRFDVSSWGLLVARRESSWIGSAVLAYGTPEVTMLEGRMDLAVLWDIRVAPEFRGRGVGSRLFEAAERWAATRRCRQIKVETQNTNVPACRFYLRHGCRLGAINLRAYPALHEEAQLLWYKELPQQGRRLRRGFE